MDIINNALGGLFINDTGVINATENITLTNYGHNFATFGKLTLNNYNNIANSAINISNFLSEGSSVSNTAYINGVFKFMPFSKCVGRLKNALYNPPPASTPAPIRLWSAKITSVVLS